MYCPPRTTQYNQITIKEPNVIWKNVLQTTLLTKQTSKQQMYRIECGPVTLKINTHGTREDSS